MWSIVKWTLWQRRWSIFWWSIGIISFIVINLVFYPSFKDQADQLEKAFGSIPSGAMELFGGTDFFSPVGYLNSQVIYLMLPLLLAILAIGLGTNLIGREEREQTIGTLLARPISRGQLLASKALAGVLIVSIVTLIATVSTLVMVKVVGLDVPLGNIALACLVCLLLVLVFGSVAFALAATGRGRAGAMGIAVIYALAGYIIGSLAGTVHWLDKPSLLFPYHYYRSADILRGVFDWSSVLFFTVFILGCGLLAWVSFRGRDLE